MARIDTAEIAIDTIPIADVKGIKRVDYTLTNKETNETMKVQFYGAVLPDFNDPTIQAKELLKFEADPCADKIAEALLAAGVKQ